MEQQRALNALEPFIALSKSASSPRAAADLVTQATSAPNTYVFSELLQTPNIQALRQSPEFVPSLRLLELFAWGSYSQYKATPNLPELNLQQTQKLRLLSLLPLCTSPRTQSYTALQTALSLPTSPPDDIALESLITQAIYSNLITAHMDPLHRTVCVTSVAPLRDPAPGSVPAMLATLNEWEGRCNDTLKGIEEQIARIKAQALSDQQREQRRKANFEAAIDNLEMGGDDGTGGSGGGGGGDAGLGGGGAGGTGGWGKRGASAWNRLVNKGGKRAAPMDNASSLQGIDSDIMDVDDLTGGSGSSKGAARATRRKGGTGPR